MFLPNSYTERVYKNTLFVVNIMDKLAVMAYSTFLWL